MTPEERMKWYQFGTGFEKARWYQIWKKNWWIWVFSRKTRKAYRAGYDKFVEVFGSLKPSSELSPAIKNFFENFQTEGRNLWVVRVPEEKELQL